MSSLRQVGPGSHKEGLQVEIPRDEAALGLTPKPVTIIPLLSRFLQTPGHVLLIQGAPGSGKTSLALELLHNVESLKLYASTRVSPSKLRQHFPWIDEIIDTM